MTKKQSTPKTGTRSKAKTSSAQSPAAKAKFLAKTEATWQALMDQYNAMSNYETSKAFEPAGSLLINALAEAEKFGETDDRLAETLLALAHQYRMARQFKEGEPLFRRALSMKEKLFGESSVQTAKVLSALAWCLEFLNGSEQEKCLLRSLEIYKTTTGSDSKETARANEELGHFYRARAQKPADLDKVQTYFEESLRIWRQLEDMNGILGAKQWLEHIEKIRARLA
jgi:tetratricopeptide (TPR) repeat protein